MGVLNEMEALDNRIAERLAKETLEARNSKVVSYGQERLALDEYREALQQPGVAEAELEKPGGQMKIIKAMRSMKGQGGS